MISLHRLCARLLPGPWPLRRLAVGTLVSAIGNGAWFTSWAVFLTRSVGLSPVQVGLGMTVTAILGVALTPMFGWLGDRAGARETFAAQLIAQGAAALAFLAVHGIAAFLIVASLSQIASSGTGGPRNALVLGLSEPVHKLEVLSRLRAISHVGWAVGAMLGGAIITLNTRPAYVALLVLNAGTYFVYAALVRSVPRVRAPAGARAPRGLRVVRDMPYMSLAGMTGTLALCWAMLSSGLPLWVALHTHAPRAISALVVVVSSLGIAAFQTRVSRGITAPARAARAALGSGAALASACLLLALTAGLGGPPAIGLILVAAALHLAGELLFVAASWGLSVPLMPPDAPSEYQGAFATGESLALMVAPALMTTLIADWGRPGWLVLAVIFLVPALAITPATRWAVRTRPAWTI
ncbi:MAG: MFS transporter [Solirubrobacteraceae bacterium]